MFFYIIIYYNYVKMIIFIHFIIFIIMILLNKGIKLKKILFYIISKSNMANSSELCKF